MEGEKSSGVEVGPPISIVRLVLMLTTVGQQYLFLQQHDIIPSTGVCHKCHQVIPGSPIVKETTVLDLQEVQGSDHNKVWHGALQIQNETKELDPSCFLLHRTKQELCTHLQ